MLFTPELWKQDGCSLLLKAFRVIEITVNGLFTHGITAASIDFDRSDENISSTSIYLLNIDHWQAYFILFFGIKENRLFIQY